MIALIWAAILSKVYLNLKKMVLAKLQVTRNAIKQLILVILKDERGKLEESLNKVSTNALNRKNPDSMESKINMDQRSIINLKKREDHQATYAANVKFVADAIVDNNTLIDTKIKESETRAIESIDRENVLKDG